MATGLNWDEAVFTVLSLPLVATNHLGFFYFILV